MTKYMIRRLLLFVPTFLLVSMGVFLALRIMPGDIATITVTGGNEPRTDIGREEAALRIKELRKLYGLDRPVHIQYADWLWGFVRGDMGETFRGGHSVAKDLRERFPTTLEMMTIAITISTVLSILIGVISAVYQDTWIDYLTRGGSLLAHAVPFFWVGTLVILFLVAFFDWIPPLDRAYLWEDPVRNLKQMILPAAVLSFFGAGSSVRLVRSAMLETLRQDYVRTARAKGLAENVVIVRHALRNALIPIVTVKGATLVGLISGSVIAETIFVVPGMGTLLIESINNREFILVQGLVMLLTIMVMVVNLGVDLTYAWLNPRITYK